MTMKKQFIRHGDVDIRPISAIPKNIKKNKTKTLAYGEVTGHHHSFTNNAQVTVWDAPPQETITVGDEQIRVEKYLEVREDSRLSHQEHKTVIVPKGVYAILQEREYNPFEQDVRRVLD